MSVSPSCHLGLLIVDEIDEPHRAIAGDYPELYGDLFGRAGASLTTFDARHGPLPDASSLDGWVIGGSRRSVYDDVGWIRDLERWVVDAIGRGTPTIGLCFGHQLVARALGASVEPWHGGWNVGAIAYEVVDPPDWLDEVAPVGQTLRLLASHRDQVTSLPDGARHLLTTPTCQVAGFTFGDHVLCLQPHPEFVAPMAASIYRSRIDRQGSATTQAALDSLESPLDADAVADWLVAPVIRHRMRDILPHDGQRSTS